MRVLDVRRALDTERGHAAITLDELMDDGLLAAIAELVRPGRTVTKAGLAQACEDAKRKATARIGADLCWCGHPYAEHIARAGCGVCDVCTGPRRVEVTPQPGPHEIGADVLVILRGDRYFGRTGFVVARDEGGLIVQLHRPAERLHFEHSELVTIPKAPLADYAKRGQ
jgi:hypothetical protein